MGEASGTVDRYLIEGVLKSGEMLKKILEPEGSGFGTFSGEVRHNRVVKIEYTVRDHLQTKQDSRSEASD